MVAVSQAGHGREGWDWQKEKARPDEPERAFFQLRSLVTTVGSGTAAITAT